MHLGRDGEDESVALLAAQDLARVEVEQNQVALPGGHEYNVMRGVHLPSSQRHRKHKMVGVPGHA